MPVRNVNPNNLTPNDPVGVVWEPAKELSLSLTMPGSSIDQAGPIVKVLWQTEGSPDP